MSSFYHAGDLKNLNLVEDSTGTQYTDAKTFRTRPERILTITTADATRYYSAEVAYRPGKTPSMFLHQVEKRTDITTYPINAVPGEGFIVNLIHNPGDRLTIMTTTMLVRLTYTEEIVPLFAVRDHGDWTELLAW